MRYFNNIIYPDRKPLHTVDEYQKMSESELMNQYKTDIWTNLEEIEKICLVKETGDRYADQLGIINKPTIEKEYDNNYYGSFCHSRNEITFNYETNSNPMRALDTIAHEENHAFQYQCMMDRSVYTDKELELLEKEASNYTDVGTAYDKQVMEIDSNNAGLEYVLQNKDAFIRDESFLPYIDERIDHFERISDLTNNTFDVSNSISSDSELLRQQLYRIRGEVFGIRMEGTAVEERSDGLEFLYDDTGTAEQVMLENETMYEENTMNNDSMEQTV